MTKQDGIKLREARRARVRLIRARVVGGSVALFLAVWSVIAVVLITGHDPALAAKKTVTVSSAAVTSTATTSSATNTDTNTTTTSAGTSTGSTSSGATSSSTGSGSSSSPSAVTSSQS